MNYCAKYRKIYVAMLRCRLSRYDEGKNLAMNAFYFPSGGSRKIVSISNKHDANNAAPSALGIYLGVDTFLPSMPALSSAWLLYIFFLFQSYFSFYRE
jgi:hypothetical protein